MPPPPASPRPWPHTTNSNNFHGRTFQLGVSLNSRRVTLGAVLTACIFLAPYFRSSQTFSRAYTEGRYAHTHAYKHTYSKLEYNHVHSHSHLLHSGLPSSSATYGQTEVLLFQFKVAEVYSQTHVYLVHFTFNL